MRTIGISIYPSRESDEEREYKYIETAGKLGFTRIFTCMISADGDIPQVTARFKKMLLVAKKNNMEAIIDVSKSVFDRYNLKYNDLSFFKELGVSGIRIDEGIDSQNVAMMTHNKEHLKMEINSSTKTKFADDILSFGANTDYLVSCHNFYPQKYTGLSRQHFVACNEDLKKKNIKVSAFVSSNVPNAFGAWDISEGVCTLEEHRNQPIDFQMRHLFMLGADEVIVGNAYASDKELQSMAELERGLLTFKMTPETILSDVEQQIVYNAPHYVRGDMGDYMARSTMTRITFKASTIPQKNTRNLRVGDVVVLNDNYGRYKGELHIITKEMPNEGNKNVVGRLDGVEKNMLDFICPWIPFKII